MSGSIKSKENFWLLSFWRLMSKVNNVEENIISGEKKPRRIKSKGNSCPGGKFWRKTYREEKVWGKDGAKPKPFGAWPHLSPKLRDLKPLARRINA